MKQQIVTDRLYALCADKCGCFPAEFEVCKYADNSGLESIGKNIPGKACPEYC